MHVFQKRITFASHATFATDWWWLAGSAARLNGTRLAGKCSQPWQGPKGGPFCLRRAVDAQLASVVSKMAFRQYPSQQAAHASAKYAHSGGSPPLSFFHLKKKTNFWVLYKIPDSHSSLGMQSVDSIPLIFFDWYVGEWVGVIPCIKCMWHLGVRTLANFGPEPKVPGPMQAIEIGYRT